MPSLYQETGPASQGPSNLAGKTGHPANDNTTPCIRSPVREKERDRDREVSKEASDSAGASRQEITWYITQNPIFVHPNLSGGYAPELTPWLIRVTFTNQAPKSLGYNSECQVVNFKSVNLCQSPGRLWKTSVGWQCFASPMGEFPAEANLQSKSHVFLGSHETVKVRAQQRCTDI